MSDLRHYYLYAKHHYQTDNLIEDLKKIHGNWCGCDPEFLEIGHIANKLLELAFVHMRKDDAHGYRSFVEFISDIAPENKWQIGGRKEDDYWTSVIKKCLSIIRLTKVSEFPFELGVPDAKILPLTKER